MDSTPLVSIVIPAFNVASVISETLNSVLAQTYANYEVLIADDGSTDDTIGVVQPYCRRDARFRLISRTHVGLSETRNAAMKETAGEFIAFLDSDDVWFPEKLAVQIAAFRENPRRQFVFTNFLMWDGERDIRLQHSPSAPWSAGGAAMTEEMILRVPICIATALARREIFSDSQEFDPRFHYCEDVDLWLRLLEQEIVFHFVPQPLVRYRQWPGNISKNLLGMAESRIAVLEKNLRHSRHPEWKPWYEASLAAARSKLELTRAYGAIQTGSKTISRHLWRAWRFKPGRMKFLTWYLLAAWPKIIGGHATTRVVHRKLVEKFSL